MIKQNILKNLFDASEDAIVITDCNLNIIDFNHGAEIIFEYKRDDIVGKNIETLIPEKYRANHPEKTKDFRTSKNPILGQSIKRKVYGLRANGTIFPALISITKSGHGKNAYYSTILRDISILVEQQEEIERSFNMVKVASTDAGLYIYELDLVSNKVYYSKHCDFLFGNVPPEAKNYAQRITQNLYPDDVDILQDAWKLLRNNNKTFDAQLRFIRSDNKLIWARIIIEAIVDEDGRQVQLVGSIKDISREVIRKQKLQEAANRLELAIESAGITVFDRDYVKNQIHIIQNTANLLDEEISVFDFPDAIIRKIHEDDRRFVLQKAEEAITSHGKMNINFRMYNLDKILVWVNLNARFLYDKDGGVARFVGAIRDISEDINAKDKLNSVANRFRIANQTAGMTIYEIDYVNNIVNAESAYEPDIHGTNSVQEFRDKIWAKIHPLDIDMVDKHWQQCITTKNPLKLEYRELNEQGYTNWVSVTGEFTEIKSGRPTKFIGTRTNITEKKLNEQQYLNAKIDAERASKAKSKFLAAMSHDMRTPLNGMLGILQIFPRENLSQKQLSLLDTCLNGSKFLSARIDDILDLTKVEQGMIEIIEKPFNLDKMFTNLIGLFEAEAEKNNVKFKLNIIGASGDYIGDAIRVQQIIDNIISNSVKYTPHGNIYINADYRDNMLEIMVQDEGIGMDSQTARRLYSLSSWADEDTVNSIAGSGIGLVVCHQLTRLMKGSIFADSEPGKGMKVTLRLPLERIPNQETWEVNNGDNSYDEINTDNIKILVAEDNPANQLVIRAMLEQINLDAEIVCNGKEAVERWNKTNFDIILMDIKMPVLDGLTATREIRKLESTLGRIRTPIVAVTANALKEQIDLYLNSGFDSVVPKPINISTLFNAIDNALFVEPHHEEANTA
jgi:PAS domain S-box-containing protein